MGKHVMLLMVLKPSNVTFQGQPNPTQENLGKKDGLRNTFSYRSFFSFQTYLCRGWLGVRLVQYYSFFGESARNLCGMTLAVESCVLVLEEPSKGGCDVATLVVWDLGRKTYYTINSIETVERHDPRQAQPNPSRISEKSGLRNTDVFLPFFLRFRFFFSSFGLVGLRCMIDIRRFQCYFYFFSNLTEVRRRKHLLGARVGYLSRWMKG